MKTWQQAAKERETEELLSKTMTLEEIETRIKTAKTRATWDKYKRVLDRYNWNHRNTQGV